MLRGDHAERNDNTKGDHGNGACNIMRDGLVDLGGITTRKSNWASIEVALKMTTNELPRLRRARKQARESQNWCVFVLE